jgi:hypothetical protein
MARGWGTRGKAFVLRVLFDFFATQRAKSRESVYS